MIDLVSFCYNRSVVDKLPLCVLTGHSRLQGLYPLYLAKPFCRQKQFYFPMFLCREVRKHDTWVTGASQETCGVVYVSEKPLIDEKLFP